MRILNNSTVILFLVLLLRVSAGAQYESQNYLPLTRAELSKNFSLDYIGNLASERPGYFEGIANKPIRKRIAVGPSGAAVIRTSENNLIINGSDKRNHTLHQKPTEFLGETVTEDTMYAPFPNPIA